MSLESVMDQIETPLDIWSLRYMVIEMITWLLRETPLIPFSLSPLCEDFLNKTLIRNETPTCFSTIIFFCYKIIRVLSFFTFDVDKLFCCGKKYVKM
ncbi:hypothetical protein CR513_38546, partial [Mucuna pruriens]